MPIPDFQTLMLPVLKSAVDGEANIGEVTASLAADFKLTEEEREQRLPSGRQTTIVNRTGWAKTYLTKAGLLEATRRSYFRITERGKQVLAENPTRIDIQFLSKFPEFEEFRKTERDGATPE